MTADTSGTARPHVTQILPAGAEKPLDARSLRYVRKDDKKVKPFVTWAGGKRQLLPEIRQYYPFKHGHITKYAEPFVGQARYYSTS